MASSPETIRRYYDKPDYDEQMRRRTPPVLVHENGDRPGTSIQEHADAGSRATYLVTTEDADRVDGDVVTPC